MSPIGGRENEAFYTLCNSSKWLERKGEEVELAVASPHFSTSGHSIPTQTGAEHFHPSLRKELHNFSASLLRRYRRAAPY